MKQDPVPSASTVEAQAVAGPLGALLDRVTVLVLLHLKPGPLRFADLRRRVEGPPGPLQEGLARLIQAGLVTPDAAGRGHGLSRTGRSCLEAILPFCSWLSAHGERRPVPDEAEIG